VESKKVHSKIKRFKHHLKSHEMQPYWVKRKDFKLFRISVWHIIVPLLVGFLITLIAYPMGFLSLGTMVFVSFYSLSIGLSSMKTYELTEWILEKRIPWLKRPLSRFFVSILVEIIIGFTILIFINYLFFIVIRGFDISSFYRTTFEAIKYMLACTVGGVVLINTISFFRNWRQSAINEEILKREKLAIEYEALKNQINPHFLFNNLTALSALVRKDQDKAINFIQELSNTLRYVLESRDYEIIELAKEQKLLESIAYMYRLRHEDSLKIKINLLETKDKYIIPMALQMLVENAIKHNVVSTSKPLVIEIEEEEGFIVVRNNYQPKMTKIASSKIGLKNIESRYQYFSDKKMIVECNSEFFTVKLPLLNKEK